MSTNLTTRTLHVLLALKGHVWTGRTLREIATAASIPEPTCLRILENMIEEGFALKLETGRYTYSIRVLQIAQAYADEMARAKARMEELNLIVQTGARN